MNGFVAGWAVIVFVLIQLRQNSSHHVALTCFLPVRDDPSIGHCNTYSLPSQSGIGVIVNWDLSLSTHANCQLHHQRVLPLSASATTCSMISDHGCCSRSSSSNDSHSRLDYCNSLLLVYILAKCHVTSTVSFTCGRSTCARPAWSCSSVSSHDTLHWLRYPQRVTFKLCQLTYSVCTIWASLPLAPDYLSRFCTLLTSVPGRPLLRSADANC